MSYEGWAYAAGSADKSWYLLYFEANCEGPVRLRGLSAPVGYRLTWFAPRSGRWGQPGQTLTVDADTSLHLPACPDNGDWGMLLERID
jgi:hypothetical protein